MGLKWLKNQRNPENQTRYGNSTKPKTNSRERTLSAPNADQDASWDLTKTEKTAENAAILRSERNDSSLRKAPGAFKI